MLATVKAECIYCNNKIKFDLSDIDNFITCEECDDKYLIDFLTSSMKKIYELKVWEDRDRYTGMTEIEKDIFLKGLQEGIELCFFYLACEFDDDSNLIKEWENVFRKKICLGDNK